jgi:hypothetical protein
MVISIIVFPILPFVYDSVSINVLLKSPAFKQGFYCKKEVLKTKESSL